MLLFYKAHPSLVTFDLRLRLPPHYYSELREPPRVNEPYPISIQTSVDLTNQIIDLIGRPRTESPLKELGIGPVFLDSNLLEANLSRAIQVPLCQLLELSTLRIRSNLCLVGCSAIQTCKSWTCITW
jgi:hypothetical protein